MEVFIAAMHLYLQSISTLGGEKGTKGDCPQQRYGNFVDGMCFRGVWGFTAIVASYVAAAVLTVFLVIVMYLDLCWIWRHLDVLSTRDELRYRC